VGRRPALGCVPPGSAVVTGRRVHRPALRLARHRGTTAHLASLYPFAAQVPASESGPLVGVDLLGGGAGFCWDPFEAYAAGTVTNPNAWILGEPGNGKSALVKCLLWRMAAIYGLGSAGRFVAIVDPKGEYGTLSEALGLSVVRLWPGGTCRLNPLEDGAGTGEAAETRALRRAGMVQAMCSTVLDRTLAPQEDAAVFAAVEELDRRRSQSTLADLAGLVVAPSDGLANRLRREPRELAEDLRPLAYGLDKLVSRSLRGMFDGASTLTLRPEDPGVVIDLSAVGVGSEALPLVMVAATGWLSRLMSAPGRRRVQVIDEAWSLLANLATARYLQGAFKLGRAHGVANLAVAHRFSDLSAQASDGTATAKIASGLLADAATRVILRQAPDQLGTAREVFGLNEAEAGVVGRLARGRALWKLAGRTGVVQHVLCPAEEALCDTDAAMSGRADPAVAEVAA
jgi:type IV secretory pathway VirB4 component